jgi:RNA polymerase sigma-54 factor
MPGASLSLSQQQRQMMVLAPQLRQSLEMLQMPLLELRAAIQEEMETNPTIEDVQDPSELSIETLPPVVSTAGPIEGVPAGTPDVGTATASGPEADEPLDFDRDIDTLTKLDDEWRDYFMQGMENAPSREDADEQRQYVIDSIRQQVSLADHLVDQLTLSDLADDDRQAAETLLGHIDDDGYMKTDIAELAVQTGIGLAHLQTALRAIQELNPVGVGARDLRECLLLQLRPLGDSPRVALAKAIITSHLDDLGANRYPRIARAQRTSLAAVEAAADLIRTLNPRPGQAFSRDQTEYIEPEVIVRKEGGRYVVVVDNDRLPHIRISTHYRQLLENPATTAEVKSYIRERIRAGAFLIRSIHQRQRTIHRIASEIVSSQQDFLEYGVTHLRPMTMAEVALRVGVHETTVSRTVANKYMQTPSGLFALKYFFTPGLKSDDGTTVSNRSIQDMIAQAVAHEPAQAPLSDQAIHAALKKQGVNVARRTVAKYRMLLKIAPAHARRRA